MTAMLSPAERRVLNELVGTSGSYKTIAANLGLSWRTVETQAENVYVKLGFAGRRGIEVRRIALILAHHEAVVRGLDRSSLRSVECSCHLTKSGEHLTTDVIRNRQRPAANTRPSPVVGRAGDAQSQDGMTAAAEPTEWR